MYETVQTVVFVVYRFQQQFTVRVSSVTAYMYIYIYCTMSLWRTKVVQSGSPCLYCF